MESYYVIEENGDKLKKNITNENENLVCSILSWLPIKLLTTPNRVHLTYVAYS